MSPLTCNKRLVKSGLQRLVICLDGADQETVEKYRVGVNFSSVVESFKLIHRIKKKFGANLPKIELQFILMRHNEQQRGLMRQFAKKLHADVYTEKTVGIDLRDSDSNKLAKQLLPIDISLSRYYFDENNNLKLKGELKNNCDVIYNSLAINSDGDVVPCCFDSYSKYIMGNVFKEKIRNIWKNKKYQALRELIAKNRKSIPMCNICSESMYENKVRKYKV